MSSTRRQQASGALWRMRPLVLGLLPVVLPLPARAQGYSQNDPWVLRLEASGSRETNANFLPGGQADWLAHAGLSLTHTRRGPKGNLALSATGGLTRYSQERQLNRYDYAANLALDRTLGARTSFRIGDNFSESSSNQIQDLTDAGILLPTAKTRYNRAFGDLTYRLGSRTSLSVNVSHNWVQFDTSALANGWTASGGVSLSWTPAVTNTFSLSGVFMTSHYLTSIADILTGAVGWTRTLSLRSSLSLSGGLSYLLPRDDERSSRPSPYVSVALSKTLERGQVRLTASHGVDQAYGYASERISDQARLNVLRTVGKKLSLNMSAGCGLSRDAYALDTGFTTAQVSLSAAYALRPNIGMSGQYGYRRSDPRGDPPALSGHTLGASLSYGRSWR
jgi:hypothetical protein